MTSARGLWETRSMRFTQEGRGRAPGRESRLAPNLVSHTQLRDRGHAGGSLAAMESIESVVTVSASPARCAAASVSAPS